jgi:hypothetical protein
MNWTFLIGLLKGSNTYETVVKILTVVAGFLAGRDANNTGTDDILAGCILSVADGISAYGQQDNNLEGNIVDGLIAALQKYRTEMIAAGKIVAVNK